MGNLPAFRRRFNWWDLEIVIEEFAHLLRRSDIQRVPTDGVDIGFLQNNLVEKVNGQLALPSLVNTNAGQHGSRMGQNMACWKASTAPRPNFLDRRLRDLPDFMGVGAIRQLYRHHCASLMLVFQVFSVVLPVSIKLAIHGSLEIEGLGRPAQIVWWVIIVSERRVGQISNDDRCIDSHREGSAADSDIGVGKDFVEEETISISSSKDQYPFLYSWHMKGMQIAFNRSVASPQQAI